MSDIDSIPYLIDTGANRIIVNDLKLLANFKSVRGGVKGVRGTAVLIYGIGALSMSLQADDGSVDKISIEGAVYVPSSPFNLIPPQLLVLILKSHDYSVPKKFEHDDKHYVLHYTSPDGLQRNFTIPLDERNMFTMRTKSGYDSFICTACHYQTSWKTFPGATHLIPDSDQDQSKESTREPITPLPISQSQESTKEPTILTIPYEERDFEPLSATPITTNFTLHPATKPLEDDPQVAMIRRKQHRLAVSHERLSHLRFPVLKLLARA